MDRYYDLRVRDDIANALRTVRTILDDTRNPQYPANVAHRYEDKFALAEFLMRTGVAAVFQGLNGLGVAGEHLGQLEAWARQSSVTLRLTSTQVCTFVREESRKVESGEHVIEKRTLLGGKEQVTEKIVTVAKEYVWSFDVTWHIEAYRGNAPEAPLVLMSRAAHIEVKTNAKITPRPERLVHPIVDANVTWLLRQLDVDHRAAFSIDRAARGCHTPRRNDEVDAALEALEELHGWCHRVHVFFTRHLFPMQHEHGRDLEAIHARDVFVPVVPLFDDPGSDGAGSVGARLPALAPSLLVEQERSLRARYAQLENIFPRDGSLITAVEAGLLTSILHVADVCQRSADGVDHVEDMLRKQLVAAIGKALTPADFSAYMDFHQAKLFKPEYHPQPFSYAVRRPDHDPEGVVSVEAQHGGSSAEPIRTAVSRSAEPRPMRFPLDAATQVRFHGDRFLHTWVSHQFGSTASRSLQRVARARQFSSFILLVGRISSADTFEPKAAIIVQNRDLLKIPLILEQIPTPKEFRDNIESLSPEQQRFAQAFRGMQLESTLFAVCIVQVKPQLEALLNLPDDSLTKEIKLTQDLMNLFIEFQIPSDLISYDGPDDVPAEQKVARVGEHVRKMLDLIDASKRRELEEAQEREELRKADFESEAKRLTEGAYAEAEQNRKALVERPHVRYAHRAAMDTLNPFDSMNSVVDPFVLLPMSMPSDAWAASPPPAPFGAAQSEMTTRTPPQSSPGGEPSTPAGDGIDYTRIPAELDASFEALDEDSALRSTIINPGDVWSRSSQKGLLAEPTTSTLAATEQRAERSKAFDLLDALTRSGAMPIEHASLHVVIAATHCFDKTLLETVIEDNMNPIEKVERSLVIVASAAHRLPAPALLADSARERVLQFTPAFGDDAPG